MLTTRAIEPVDYLIIGHLTQDLTPKGPQLGGTAAYSALTARALGLRVGIVTAWSATLPLPEMEGIQIVAVPGEHSTTFENTYTPTGRIQHIYHLAPRLELSHVPETWRHTPIVHLGPIAQEVDPGLVRAFPASLLGLTPQGWLRDWDAEGRVSVCEWPEARFVLEHASAAVLSIEDLAQNEDRVQELASSSRVLVVTEGSQGCRLFWNGDVRRFRPPQVEELDPVGAGDIFATCFFARMHTTRDPWEAARFATLIAATSVTRRGLQGVPTSEEVQARLVEVL